MTRGRIKRRSKRLKTPSNSHVVESAVRIGESQQTRRSGKKGVCGKRANSRDPTSRRRRRRRRSEPARDRQMPRGTPAPLAGPKSSGRGGSTSEKTLGAPRDPPSSPAHLKGGKKKKKKTQEAKLPKKFPRKGKSKAQKEQSLKGEKMSYTKRTLPQFPLSQRPKAQDTTWH